MRFASKLLLILGLVFCGAAQGQQTVNPITQIRWNLLSGSGTPTATGALCDATHISMFYQDTSVTPNTLYSCNSSGWKQAPVNPTSQIQWPLVTGSGAPTATCDAAHYGQPYQDTSITPNTFYTCGNDGWAIRTGGPGPAGTPGAQGPPGVASAAGPAGSIQAAAATPAGQLSVATTNNMSAAIGKSLGYVVMGDSIAGATGTTSTGPGNVATNNGYAFLMRDPVGGPFLLGANPGDQIADNTYKWSFRTTNPLGSNLDPFYVSELGTNDAIVYQGNTDKQNDFKIMMQAQLVQMGVPQGNKTFAQNCTGSGGFAADLATPLATMGAIATTINATLSCVVTSPKANDSIYVVYQIEDANTGTFTIKVDGNTQTDPISGSTTFVNFGYNGSSIQTQNGIKDGYAAVRLTGFAAGNHTVLITVTSATGATAKVPIEYVATAPVADSTNNPFVLAVSPNQQNGTVGAPFVAAYQGFIQSIVTNLVADGLNEAYVDTAAALLNDPSCGNGNQTQMFANCYADTIHPNNAGHQLMETTILASTPTFRKPGVLVWNRYQRIQQWINANTVTSAPLFNPAHFFDINPYVLQGDANHWVPGIKFQGSNGQLTWMGFQAQTGLTVGAPVAGVAGFSFCPSGGGGIMPALPPLASACHLIWQPNGLFNFFGGSTAANGLSIQSGVMSGGSNLRATWPGQFQFTGQLSGVYSTTQPVNASTNNNSPCFNFNGGIWNGTNNTPGFSGPCLQSIAVNPTPAGQIAQAYLTLQPKADVSVGVDFRNSVLTNHYGNGDAGTLAIATANITALNINGVSFNVIRGTTSAIGGSALTAGTCASTGPIAVAGAGAGNVVQVTPAGGGPGDAFTWRGYPTGSGFINVQVCATVAGTPSSQAYAYMIVP